MALLGTVGITSVSVTERVQLSRYGERKKGFFLKVFNVILTLYRAVRTLPRRIGLIFCIQLCSWYGWFLFLFYSSTWVGEVYMKNSVTTPESGDEQGQDTVGNIARVGSLSLTVFSSVSLLFSLLLPEVLRRVNRITENDGSVFPGSSFLGLGKLPRNSFHRKFRQGIRFLVLPLQELFKRLASGKSVIGKVDITLFWLVSQILYALTSFAMIYVRSLEQASVIVGLFGACWAVTTWAPFSLLAEEVLLIGQAQHQALTKTPDSRETSGQKALLMRGSRAQDIEMIAYDDSAPSRLSTESSRHVAQPFPTRGSHHARSSTIDTIELYIAQPAIDEQDQLSPKRKLKQYIMSGSGSGSASDIDTNEPLIINSSSSAARSSSDSIPFPRFNGHNRDISLTEDDFYSDGSEIISTTGEHSGVYLGLHNVAITVPQLVSTFVSFLVFSMLEPTQLDDSSSDIANNDLPSSTKGDGGFAIAATMQLGGITALLSAYFIIKLRRELN